MPGYRSRPDAPPQTPRWLVPAAGCSPARRCLRASNAWRIRPPEIPRSRPLASVSVCDARSTFTGASGFFNSSAWTSARNHNRQQRILQRIALENIRERSADHRAESILRQRPGSMLARTAASEVVAGQQNLRGLRLGLVQNEIRLRRSVGVVAPVAEKLIAQSVLRNRLQESRRNDLIRIDVVERNQHHAALKRREFLHYSNSLTSVTMPVIADAAAVSGLARNVRPPLPCRPSKLRLLVDTLYSPGCS